MPVIPVVAILITFFLQAPSKPVPERQLYLQDVAWSPDGKRIAFSRYSATGPYEDKHWTVWTADRDGSNPRAVLRGAIYVTFSPDGNRLAAGMLFDGDWEIVTVRTDGSDLRRITHRAGDDDVPSWSPDGRFLVYTAKVDGNIDLYQVSVDGGEPRRLTQDPAGEYNPVFSADGRHLVFYREKGDQHDQVWTLDLTSGRETRITNGTGHSFFPTFPPDGRIGFSGQADNGERRLMVISKEGSRPEPIGPAGISFARWSPDGREVLFVQNGKGEIQRMAADGSGVAVRLDASKLDDSR